ncbi:hypothetical protein RIVERRIDER_2 [Xanthomonas phage RiverRider]|uniref:Uncharacterized protein n=1 Tax=Xanthomonas phage RiverRider TaxID=2108116 RepID=A0A2P1JUQ6_9CAUD|nr:hypothetical protein HWB58_gp02 [Xanthomonas phage RiverRider]AVO23090.1 hypothetical protein RIVERRIDER_2 [Xanthomonas phage RiverRider]
MNYIGDNIWHNEVATDLYPVGYYFSDETNDLNGPYDNDTAAAIAACSHAVSLG